MNDRRDASGTPGKTEHVESSSSTVKLSPVTSKESTARVVRVREEKKIEGGGEEEGTGYIVKLFDTRIGKVTVYTKQLLDQR